MRILRVLEALGGLLVRVLRVLEALGGSFVRILRALRPWEARTYVFYEVLKPPGFEGRRCGVVNWRGLGRTPRAVILRENILLDIWSLKLEI